jgi:hypothetical protein
MNTIGPLEPAGSPYRVEVGDQGADVAGEFVIVVAFPCDLSGAEEDERAPAARFSLAQNTPNPFNPTTVVRFSIPHEDHVLLRIYDLAGRAVATILDQRLPAGPHAVVWDATGLSSGIYVYRIHTAGRDESRKAILAR